MDDADRLRHGMTVRREVLGDEHVDRAVAGTTEFTAPFQDLITRYAWGEIWARPGLTRAERSIITLTALAAIAYYRRRIFTNAWDAILVGILPLASAVFLAWVVVKSVISAPAEQRWSLAGIIGAGVVLMLVARFVLRSPFFQIPRESAPREG